ncbi:lipoprotein [Motilimonas pumila]|uniref:Type IV secretion system putative lipoprotein virB7 n=1 Tax=Motilimonas pumila TaxID=2303987 RepID=A0A418YDI6_9GAMM|nr:lipoprotein [Motilimonas pumila]RJG42547.1 hypothetical protein D1Z90_12855 [Motilimonas pumila]
MKLKKIFLVFSAVLALSACQHESTQWHKLDFDIKEINDKGLKNGVGVDFEFCLAQQASLKQQVQQAYSGLQFQQSPGRIGCNAEQWLVIGNTLQPNYRQQLTELVAIAEVSEIKQTFWE